MSFSNVLPSSPLSAPELYSELPGADNFRLTGITEIEKKIKEAEH